MRNKFKTLTTIPVLIFAGALTLNACSTPEGNSEASTAPVMSTINDADFAEGVKILYNADTRFEYPKAVERLEAALKSNPDSAETKFHLAYAYVKRSKYDDSKALLESLADDDSGLTESQKFWLSAMTAKVEDQTSAEIQAWKKIVANNPADRWAWYELSSVQSTAELYADAAMSSEKALEAEPDAAKWESSWIYYLLSKAYYRSGEPEAGIAAAQKGKDNKTTWRSTYFRQSLAELKSGERTDHEDVVSDYIEVSNSEGRNNITYTYANIALFYHELGDLQNAEIFARKAYEVDPKGYQTWALGFILADNGKAKEGLELLTAGAEEFPEDNYVHAAKGWTEYRLGDLREAQLSFAKALENTGRRNYSIEGMAATINEAANNPDLPAVPQIPWLG